MCAGAFSATAKTGHDFQARPDDWFRSAEGGAIITNVLSWQSAEGGWPKNTDTFSEPFTGKKTELHGTFDNGATIPELQFLARAFKITGNAACREACLRGVQHIVAAQYGTGGWPQYFPPPRTKYHRHITFNDNAMVNIMEFVREVANSGKWDFLDKAQRDAAQQAFDRGIACILKCQIKVNGRLTGWCAQHDEVTLEPRPARTFELASISGAESVGIVRLLMSLDHPGKEVVQAIEGAMAWFQAAKLPGIKVIQRDAPGTPKGTDKAVAQDQSARPMWARFYEIESNKPIFSGRDGVKKYALADIEYERRNGYSWLGYWPEPLIEREYPEWKKREGQRAKR